MKFRFALLSLLATVGSAHAASTVQNVFPSPSTTSYNDTIGVPFGHYDIDGSQLPKDAAIQMYVSTGAGQYNQAVTTNWKPTTPLYTTLAEICVEGASVRYRDDGVAASATVGIPVNVGSAPFCFAYAGPVAALSFTAQSGSPTISVSYYRNR